MGNGRYAVKNRAPDRRGNHVPACTKGNAADIDLLIGLFTVLVISLGIWLAVLPHSLAAQITMDVYQTSGNKVFGQTTSLDIFGESAANGDPILYPGCSGSYTFSVYNNSSSNHLPYSVTFESENNYNIPIAVTIQKDAEYIFGLDSATDSLTSYSTGDMMLKGNATDYYTVKWRWITTSDEADTALGIMANDVDMWYTLTITARGELEEVGPDPDSGGGSVTDPTPVTPPVPDLPGITQDAENFGKSVQEKFRQLITALEDILIPGGRMGGLATTGDYFNSMAWVALGGVSFAGIVLLLLIKRRRKDDGEDNEGSSENN